MRSRRSPFRSPPLLALAFAVALLVAGASHAFAACSGTASFFVYGKCASALVPPDNAVHAGLLFRPAPRPDNTTSTDDTTREGGSRIWYAHVEAVPQRGAANAPVVPARLTVRCRDGNTSLYFTFPGKQMGNKGPQREIVYALDDRDEKILEAGTRNQPRRHGRVAGLPRRAAGKDPAFRARNENLGDYRGRRRIAGRFRARPA